MKLFYFIVIAGSLLFAPGISHAQDIIPNPNDRGSVTQQRLPCTDTAACNNSLNPIAGDFGLALNTLWGQILTIMYLVLGALAVIMLIIAGIQYIISSGQPELVKKARQNIINTILGILILGGSYAIIRLAVTIASAVGR